MGIIVFILILALLVLVHEFGHFLMAKLSGVKVEEFGIGFPPRLFGIKRGETLYSVNIIPLGGFVKMFGEEAHEVVGKGKKSAQSERAFVNKKPWQKALIIVAGVIGNFLLGWILVSYLFTQGVPAPANKVIVEDVQKGSPAAIAGIKINDSIVRLDSTSLTDSTELIDLTKKYAGQPVHLVIERGNKQINVTVTPRKNPPSGQGALGIAITSFVEKKYPFYKAPFYGLSESVSITRTIIVEIVKAVFSLVTLHKPSVEVSGPIGIASYTGQAIKFGKNAVLELIALLSLNLAIVNILPFPALDGGRFVFVIYEWVTKKRVNEDVERYTNLVGFFILILLAIFISINDIVHLMH